MQKRKPFRQHNTIRHDTVIKGLIIAAVISTLVGFQVMLSLHKEHDPYSDYASVIEKSALAQHQAKATHVNPVNSWSVWDKASVLPNPDKYLFCQWHPYKIKPDVSSNKVLKQISVCLPNERNHDGNGALVKEIIKEGFSSTCANTASLWNQNDAEENQSELINPAIFIDAGANIGICVIHMLLTTNSKIIAFEPNPQNLFYMTSSLKALGDAFIGRVELFPIALGQTSRKYHFFSIATNTTNNGDNTAIPVADNNALSKNNLPLNQKSASKIIHVEPLDSILRNGTKISVMKISTGGCECDILQGMEGFVSSVEIIQFGLSSKGKANNCTSDVVFNMLEGSHIFYSRKGKVIEHLPAEETRTRHYVVAHLK